MKYILSGWTLLKGVRVGLGLLILYSGIESHSAGWIVAGAVFTLFGLLSPGTCCGTGCYSREPRHPMEEKEEIVDYEELGVKE